MTPEEKDDQKVREDMKAIARTVDRQLPYGWGYVVLAFPFGEGGRLNYVANAQRQDVVRSMYEFIEATKEQFGEQVADISNEDEEIGRLRQRVAQLERELEKR